MKNIWILATSQDDPSSRWHDFVENKRIRINYKVSEDLTALYEGGKTFLKAHLREKYPNLSSTNQDVFWRLGSEMQIGDIVIARRKLDAFVGVGEIIGDYEYLWSEPDYKHSRRVRWLSVEEKPTPGSLPKRLAAIIAIAPDWNSYEEIIELIGGAETEILGRHIAEVQRAKEFIAERVLKPVINSPRASEKAKNVTKATLGWLEHFERTGDLLVYMDRFDPDANATMYSELLSQGFETFEGIREELEERFGAYRSDRTRLNDFVIGDTYSSQQILIAAETYDTRSGGILALGPIGHHKAVFIKATLSGGKYPNEWLEEGRRLKYYLKSIKGVFKESYKHNQAIIEYPEVPIYAFVRHSKDQAFKFAGVYGMAKVHDEDDGSKWFELLRRDIAEEGDITRILTAIYEQDLKDRVERSKSGSSSARHQRLAAAPSKPDRVTVQSQAFVRNADVIVEVLSRANGLCESCGKRAPFLRKSDNTPYLEVHHSIRLADGGDDTVENAIALCPNCHRRAHYG